MPVEILTGPSPAGPSGHHQGLGGVRGSRLGVRIGGTDATAVLDVAGIVDPLGCDLVAALHAATIGRCPNGAVPNARTDDLDVADAHVDAGADIEAPDRIKLIVRRREPVPG